MAKNKKVFTKATARGGKSTADPNPLSIKKIRAGTGEKKSAADGMLDLRETLWQLVASIPPGRVASYGQLARLAGFPRHARYVGTTLRNLPRGTTLPWFRVLRGSGELAFPPASAAWKKQKALLEDEGIIFRGMKVALRQYQWEL